MGLLFSKNDKAIVQKVTDVENLIAQLKETEVAIDVKFKALEQNRLNNEAMFKQERAKIDEERRTIKKIYSDAKIGNTKWLAYLVSEFYKEKQNSLVSYFAKKSHPISIKTATELKKTIKEEIKILRAENLDLKYQIEKYRYEAPDVVALEGDDIEEYDSEPEISSNLSEKEYYRLSQEDYAKLEPIEKSELALERYWKKRKSKSVLGRDYERYIGYKYEVKGYKVTYNGINKGFDDLGIDLICEKNNNVILVQCKYWKESVPIRENTICQLYGTYAKFCKDIEEVQAQCVLITSTTLSNRAKDYAKSLNVTVAENIKLDKYPIIKCNINNGQKIYHLPFDQQYDNVKIENKGEFYAWSVKEAVENGFRRAYRWHGNN